MRTLAFAALGAFAVLFNSCNSGPDEEGKKYYKNMVEGYVNTFSGSVDAYCSCVGEKGVDACQGELDQLMANYEIIQPTISSGVENGLLDKKEEVDAFKARTKELFDKKAKCAEEAMNKPAEN